MTAQRTGEAPCLHRDQTVGTDHHRCIACGHDFVAEQGPPEAQIACPCCGGEECCQPCENCDATGRVSVSISSPSEPRCSLCGASRIPMTLPPGTFGACTNIECPEPLHDFTVEDRGRRSPEDLPRFFIDHGMIHDRVTGKHVTTYPDSPQDDGITKCCELLNSLAVERELVAAGVDIPAFLEKVDQRVAEVQRSSDACSDAGDGTCTIDHQQSETSCALPGGYRPRTPRPCVPGTVACGWCNGSGRVTPTPTTCAKCGLLRDLPGPVCYVCTQRTEPAQPDTDRPAWLEELIAAGFAMLGAVDDGSLLGPPSQRLTDALAMIPRRWAEWGPEQRRELEERFGPCFCECCQIARDALKVHKADAWHQGAKEASNEILRLQATAHAAVQALVRAMWLYQGYRIDSRGPVGCLIEAIRHLEPETARKIEDGEAGDDWGLLRDREPDESAPSSTRAGEP